MKNRDISDSEIVKALVVRFGAQQVMEHYIDDVHSRLSLAETFTKEGNPQSSALELGKANQSMRVLRGLVRDSDIAAKVKEASEDIGNSIKSA